MYSLGLFICALLPSIQAKGGKGGGDEGGDVGGDVADGVSNATSNLDLAPLPAAAFAFYVISAVCTAFFILIAFGNISRRLGKRPPAIALPEYSVGPIFPAALLLATLTFLVYTILNAVLIGLTENLNLLPSDIPELPDSFFLASLTMGYLTNFFLISGTFALLAQREKVLVVTPQVIRGAKIIFDATISVILLALSMARVGLSDGIFSQTETNVYLGYISFLLIAAVDIAISSIVLYFRAKRSLVDDHKVCVFFFRPISKCLLPSSLLIAFLPSYNQHFSTPHSSRVISDHPLECQGYAYVHDSRTRGPSGRYCYLRHYVRPYVGLPQLWDATSAETEKGH